LKINDDHRSEYSTVRNCVELNKYKY